MTATFTEVMHRHICVTNLKLFPIRLLSEGYEFIIIIWNLSTDDVADV